MTEASHGWGQAPHLDVLFGCRYISWAFFQLSTPRSCCWPREFLVRILGHIAVRYLAHFANYLGGFFPTYPPFRRPSAMASARGPRWQQFLQELVMVAGTVCFLPFSQSPVTNNIVLVGFGILPHPLSPLPP